MKKILILALAFGMYLPLSAHEAATEHTHEKSEQKEKHDHDGHSHDEDSDEHGDHSHEHDGDTHDHDHEHVSLDTLEAKASYASGVRAARTLKTTDVDIDLEAFYAAIEDVLSDHELALSDQEMRDVNREIAQARRAKAEEKRKAQQGMNLENAEAFLEENKGKEGVVTTKSGLQYKVLKAGSGDTPGTSDRVKVHYEGKLLDGSVFDSSYNRGTPATFGVTQVIKGWTEVLQLMTPGSTYEVYIHPDLAYGPTGNGRIAANSLLIFKVELIGVE